MTSTLAGTSSENIISRFCNHFLIIQSHYARKMCSNYPGMKLNIGHHRLTSSTELQNMYSLFHVVERTRSSEKNENVQNMQNCFSLSKLICKFIRCLLPTSSWLLKLPNDTEDKTKGEFLDPLRDVSC